MIKLYIETKICVRYINMPIICIDRKQVPK